MNAVYIDNCLTLHDGRILQYTIIGAPALDRVALYFHGTPESRLTTRCADKEKLARLGVSVVSFDRPGYGLSTPHKFSLRSVADDAHALLAHLGVNRAALIGQSGGGPFALAYASLYPVEVTGVVATSSPGSFTEVPGAWELLSAADQQAAELIDIDADRAAGLFDADFRTFCGPLAGDFQAAEDYVRSILANDPQIADDPHLLRALTASLREGVRQGVRACSWDNVAWIGRWGVDLTAISAPTTLIYGARDASTPRSHGEWLSTQIPGAIVTIWEDSGHLGILQKFEEVFTYLINLSE